jgi:aspartate-semialdehyde dehydrogenase
VLIAVVGATGAVGREILAILAERGVRASSVRALASARSTGKELAYAGDVLIIEPLGEDSFAGVDVALFSAGAATARRFAPAAVASGATVIDNSSAFRMDTDVPLVVPEVNAELIAPSGNGRTGTGRIIANPNCSTIILVTALDPLRRAFGIERIVVSTYQAASGAGAAAMRELSVQTGAILAGEDPAPVVFAEPCAFNVFSHDTPVDADTGRNVEEQKVIEETRKIFDQPGLGMSVTCIRVPVLRAHAESVNVTVSSPATETQVRDALAAVPGIALVDNRAANDFPTSLKASGRDEVLVGRIRGDESQDRDGDAWCGFELFIAGDQLRKGAALNALQIADLLLG